jgi:hypothetical protein
MSEFDFKESKKDTSVKAEDLAATETKAEVPEGPKYSPEELMAIFDDMIFSGGYTEVVGIHGGKLKVGLRTRSAEEIDAITMKLDSTNASLLATINEKRSILNLHYALVSFQGKDFTTAKVEDKAAFINKLPAAVVGAIMRRLSVFDEKVYAACREGEENF